jgi:acylphosphatase
MRSQSPATRSVQVRIEGLVQGVAYRAWTESEANELGLGGWVRNRRDGTVEAVFSGDAAAVTEMLRRCERGPPSARVEGVRIVGEDVDAYHSFEVRPTA